MWAVALVAAVLVAGGIGAYLLTRPDEQHPAERTVRALLQARSRRASDVGAYRGLVELTSTAQALAQSAELETSSVTPIPQWRSVRLVAAAGSNATVTVMWSPDEDHPRWASTTNFRLKADRAGRYGWTVTDAIESGSDKRP